MEQVHNYILKNYVMKFNHFSKSFLKFQVIPLKKIQIGNSSVGLKKRMIVIPRIYMIQLKGKEKELIQDEMSPLNFKKFEMGSSSKNLKQSFLPPGALARGRGQSLKSMGSVRVTAEKRTLIDPTNRMLETLRSKSEKETGQNFTSMGYVKGSIVVQGILIGKSKGYSAAYSDRNELASDKNLMQPCLDLIEDETFFPQENLDEMQEAARCKPAKENGQNFTSVCSSKESNVVQRMPNGKSKNYSVPASSKNELEHNKNLMQPGFDPIEVDTLISYHDLEKRIPGRTLHLWALLKGSIVVNGTSIGKKDETSFPHENLDVMQETARSKTAKEKGQNFTSLSSVRRSVEKRKMIRNNKGLNSVAYDKNVVAQKTNVVPPYFDEMECDTSFPHDNLEVMQDTLRSKFGKANKEIFTSLDSDRGSTFQQRTSIRKSKGYSVVSSDTNVLAHNKNLRQSDFSQIEHDTAFPHDELEVMQHDLRSKSAREQAQSFTSTGSIRRCAEKRTLNGQSKDSENAEYELNELAQNNNCVLSGSDPMEDDPTLPRDEVEVMQDNQRRKTISSEFEKVKKVRGPNLTKIQELLQVESSLTNIEVVESCFGPQSKSHVVGFGGGITSKDLKGGSAAKTALLKELKASQK
ncbi:hypothetical protein KY289_001436 [Solanum tuberosum]|nr:hypothetical protein KY289_001436 [Solanum tuberosum]